MNNKPPVRPWAARPTKVNPLPKPTSALSRVSSMIRYPVKSYTRIPPTMRILSAGIFINRAGGFVISFLVLILAVRHYSADEIGVALILSAAFGIAGASIGGTLISWFGSRWTLFLTMIASAVFTAALIPASTFPAAIVIICFISVFNRAYIPASATMVARLARPGERVQMYAFYQLSLNTGAVIGPAIAGFLLTRSLTALLLIDAATSVCFALAGLRLPADTQVPPTEPPAPNRQQVPGRIRDDWRYLLFCVAVGLAFVAYRQSSGPLPLIFKNHHYNLELLGYLFSGSAIAGILFLLPVSYIARRFPLWIPLVTSALLIGGAYTLLLVDFSPPFLIANFAMWTMGDMILCPLAMEVATTMSTDRTHGTYQSAYTVARTAGMATGPPIGVFLYSAGASLVWWGTGLLGVITAGMFFISLRHLPRPHSAAGSAAECCSQATTAQQRPDPAGHDRSVAESDEGALHESR